MDGREATGGSVAREGKARADGRVEVSRMEKVVGERKRVDMSVAAGRRVG